MARCDDHAVRQAWRSRIEDHDGGPNKEGGIERWLRLADAVGLDRDYVASKKGALATSKFATEMYVRFVAENTLLEAVASSLTELFAPKIHKDRIAGLLEHYDFADENTLAYFKTRLVEAPKDVAYGLSYVLDNADTADKQDAVEAALVFKTDVLWSQLDALYYAYVEPGHIPARRLAAGRGAEGGLGRMTDLAPDDIPFLPRGVRLREDPERGWLLLAPERLLTLDPIATAILQELDGSLSFGALVDRLAENYAAPRDQIEADAKAFLVDLIEKRMVETKQ